jgi:hypothetical protein
VVSGHCLCGLPRLPIQKTGYSSGFCRILPEYRTRVALNFPETSLNGRSGFAAVQRHVDDAIADAQSGDVFAHRDDSSKEFVAGSDPAEIAKVSPIEVKIRPAD